MKLGLRPSAPRVLGTVNPDGAHSYDLVVRQEVEGDWLLYAQVSGRPPLLLSIGTAQEVYTEGCRRLKRMPFPEVPASVSPLEERFIDFLAEDR